MKRKFLFSATILLVALISACASDPPTRFYTLNASPELAVASSNKSNASFGVGPIHLSGALENIGIVTSNGQHQLVVSAFNVWAEGLEKMISNVIADNLSTLSGNPRVWAYPWDSRTRPEHQLRLIIEEFGGEIGGVITLRAKWTLLSEYGKQERQTHRVRFQEQSPTSDYAGYVATMNSLLTKLSKQLHTEAFAEI